MIISENDLKYCLDKASDISENYKLTHLAADDPQRSVDKLISTCKSYLGKSIQLIEIDIDKNESPIWGSCIALEKSYDICYVQGLNYCWKRFVICKEVFHTILDEDHYCNMALDEHIDEVTVAFPKIDSDPCLSVVAEWLAEIAAMEFLFPYKSRLIYDGKVDHRAVAEKYKVPLVMIEKYLSKPHMNVLQKFSKQV